MSEIKAIYEVKNNKLTNKTKEIQDVLNDKSISNWLRWALSSALHRDPIDVTNDASILKSLLENRANEILKKNTVNL